MFNLGGSDAEGQRAERTVGSGVAIAAHDGHARHGQTLFWSNHVHDALAGCAHCVFDNAELGGVGTQHVDLLARDGIGNRLIDIGGRNVVILGSDGEFGATNAATIDAETVESLR